MADTSERYSNSSVNSIAISNYNNIELKEGLTDEDFMAVIKNFPAVYDRCSEAFKDKTFKEEAWEKISEYFDMRIEDVKRRYDTIRKRLSRYLKKAKEGYWVNDTNKIDSKIDFMSWLIPHIITRESSLLYDNMRRDIFMNNSTVGRENQYVRSNCSEPSPMTSQPVRVATTSTNPSSRQYIDLMYDEDEHYCKSLVGRFKQLDSKHKAYLRDTIDNTLLDFELGYVQFP